MQKCIHWNLNKGLLKTSKILIHPLQWECKIEWHSNSITETCYSFFLASKEEEENLQDLKKELELDVHQISVEELCRRLGTNLETGLTTSQAKANLERDGREYQLNLRFDLANLDLVKYSI